MSEREAGGTTWDAPNQQVVRDDASAPWEEGSGGEAGTPVEDEPNPLDSMTKDELLDEAEARGVEVPSGATKAEVREAIDKAEAG